MVKDEKAALREAFYLVAQQSSRAMPLKGWLRQALFFGLLVTSQQ